MSTAAAATATGAEVAAVDFYAAGYEPGMPISRDEYALLMAHKSEPVFFVSDALGRTPWDKQEAVLESVRDYRETHVAAANGVGKTDTLAEIPLWWLLTGRGIVITTANTWTQVESVLWERIRLIAAEAPEDLGLTFSRTRTDLGEQWFAIGLSTREEARFAGYHEERVLVLVEEAIGVEQPILDAIDGILVGEQDRLVLQGNPLNRDTAWYRRWKQARDLRRRAIAEGRRPDHNTITISAFDTPNVKERRTVIPGMTTHGKVMADIERWGEEDPRTYARVHGLWPPEGSVGLYPLEWLERAYNYDVAEKGPLPGPKRAGLDVAR